MREFWGHNSANLKLADLHIHSNCSDGSLTPEQIVEKAVAGNLSAIAVTDHELIEGGKRAYRYCQRKGYPLEVIIGTEITTRSGHLLALYFQNNSHYSDKWPVDILSGKSVEWTATEIQNQKGLVIIPHPLFGLTRSLGRKKILNSLTKEEPRIHYDGFEIFNAGVYDNPYSKANENAREFFREHGNLLGAPLGGTDAHFFTLGRGLTGFKGDLYQAIKKGETAVLYQEEKEQLELFPLVSQLYAGLFKEPTRRMKRFLGRNLAFDHH